MTAQRRPTRLEVLAARAQLALDHKTSVSSPRWLTELAATDVRGTDESGADDSETRSGATLLPTTTRRARALARLRTRPMEGKDVLDLQRQLVDLGYADDSLIDGVFRESTEIAVRRMQNDYDILNDGVCGKVTQRVLKFLEQHGINRDRGPTVQQRHMISFIVRTQQGGFVVLDLVSHAATTADRYATLANSLIDEVGHLLEARIAAIRGVQSWVLNGTDFPTQDEEEIAAFTNDIKAELMITLSVTDLAVAGPGCATYYFGSTDDVYSHVGRPLAESIQTDVVRIARTSNRGVHPENSRLFEQAKAPTVRVEFGNVADDHDRGALQDPEFLDRLSVGIASGIQRFYLFGQDDDTAFNLGSAMRS
jgi:peptidoglycan hydrolase-like protein with peptidoglycan-binding domain